MVKSLKKSHIFRSSFISPGKRGTNARFDALQFVTPFTQVSRYPGAWNCKKQIVEKTVLIMWSQIWEKNGLIVRKYTLKKIILKIWTSRG